MLPWVRGFFFENEMSEITFEIPQTPENLRAMEQLKKQFFDAPCTLYAEYKDGNIFPVANISKHPDCPDGLYENMIKRFTAR